MNTDSVLDACRARIAKGDASGALLELEALLRREPGNEAAWLMIAEGVSALGNRAEAAKVLAEAAQVLSSSSLALSAAKRFIDIHQEKAATRLLRKFVLEDKASLELLRFLAGLDISAGRWQDANFCLERALQFDPENDSLFADYVATGHHCDKAGKALAYWPRFAKTTRDIALLGNMSTFFLHSGSHDQAAELLDRALNIAQHPNILVNAGILSSAQCHFDKAADFFIAAANRGNTRHASLVAALLMANRDDEARGWLKKAPDESTKSALKILLDDHHALKLRALLQDSRFDEKAWLGHMRELEKQQPDADGALASLLLCKILRARFPGLNLKTFFQSFPQNRFVVLVASEETDFLSAFRIFFNVFAIGQLSAQRDIQAIQFIFEAYFLSACRVLLAHRKTVRFYILSVFSYFYVRTDPTATRFKTWVSSLTALMEPWFANFPERPFKPVLHRDKPLKIAYVTDHDMHEEAPDHVLLGLLSAISESGNAKPIVMACGALSETLELRCEEAGIEVIAAPVRIGSSHAGGGVEHCRRWLASELSRRDIDVVVFYATSPVTCALLAPFLPVCACLYDSVAHLGLDLPVLDGYMFAGATVGSKRIDVDGVEWWFYESRHRAKTPSARQIALAREERAKLGGAETVVLGAIARAVKLTDEFLDVVAAILKARPQALFVWTDFLHDPQVQARLEARGIAGRCYYAGYVDYVAWTEVLDIHLDPFPFASGLTMRQTFHRGRAYVLMAGHYRGFDNKDRYNALGLGGTTIEPLFALPADHAARRQAEAIFGAQRERLALAESCAAYVDWAIRLIDDASLRASVGETARVYSDAFLTDMRNVANTHLAGIRYFLNKKAFAHNEENMADA